MFRRVLAILIMCSLLSTGFTRFFVYAGFQLNKKYIAENLCINKNRPWLHCNGRCYFMRKVKQAEEDDRKQDAKDNLNRLEVSYFQQLFQINFTKPKLLQVQKQAFRLYTYHYVSRYNDTIFRPPKLIV